MKQNGAVYYYITNLQGDVVRLVNAAGNTAAWYKYDPYGNATTASGSHATINPLRYRGYYYDTETGLYYCQSRYYDPVIGRFINADACASTGQGIVGCNMFAYCGNNPVNLIDSEGNMANPFEESDPAWFGWKLGEWIGEELINPILSAIPEIITDISNFDEDNTSEQKVLESNYFSSYKGVPVFRTNGDRSGSFGAMFITRGTNNLPYPENEDMVRHEYGHVVQMRELGVVKYFTNIFVPSWQEWGTKSYYNKPWEVTADLYGRVQSRNPTKEDIMEGFAYLDASKQWGPIAWLCVD